MTNTCTRVRTHSHTRIIARWKSSAYLLICVFWFNRFGIGISIFIYRVGDLIELSSSKEKKREKEKQRASTMIFNDVLISFYFFLFNTSQFENVIWFNFCFFGFFISFYFHRRFVNNFIVFVVIFFFILFVNFFIFFNFWLDFFIHFHLYSFWN